MEISAVVVTCDDARYLHQCLNSIKFCDQILVLDVGSKNECFDIAKEFNIDVMKAPRVDLVEQVREYAINKTKFDWVLFADPDEVINQDLAIEIKDVSNSIDNSYALIKVPIQFYFRSEELITTYWGKSYECTYKSSLFHKDRVVFKPLVHRNYEIRKGFRECIINRKNENFISHYWCDSYKELFNKHIRYLKHEGESRYKSGQRFAWQSMLMSTTKSLYDNLVIYQGIKGGVSGISLSFFYAWYEFMGWLSLKKYEFHLKNN